MAQDNTHDEHDQKVEMLSLMISQTAMFKQQSNMISMQISKWNKNKDSYISQHGENVYNVNIVSLLQLLITNVQQAMDNTNYAANE